MLGVFRFVIFIETDKNNIVNQYALIERAFIDEIGMISSFISIYFKYAIAISLFFTFAGKIKYPSAFR